MADLQKQHQIFYDNISEEWSRTKSFSFYAMDSFKAFEALCKKGWSILELGCGYARDVPLFLGIGNKLKYEGTDISPKMLKIARERYPQLKFFPSNILEKKTLPAKTYDGFWAAALFQHIPLEHWDALLTNVQSIMKPGALGYFSMPIDRPVPPSPEDPRHFTVMTQDQIKAILARHGWQIKKEGLLDSTQKTSRWYWFVVQLPKKS